MALEPATEDSGEMIPADSTLLPALLRLMASGSAALLVEENGQIRGQISLASISRAVQAVRGREAQSSDGRMVDARTRG
jgi:hypothetical protein